MNSVTSKFNLSHNTTFTLPDFRVGTLDSLGLSDELGKLDTFAESLIKRRLQSMVKVVEDSKGKVHKNFLSNGVDLTSFVTHFEWDMTKCPAKQPVTGEGGGHTGQATGINWDRPEVLHSHIQCSEGQPGELREIHGQSLHLNTERYRQQRTLYLIWNIS